MAQVTLVKTVISQTRLLQRFEGLVFFVAAVVMYAAIGASWWLFALLLFVPDIAMVGYGINNAIGQAAYNFVHTYALPLLLALLSFVLGHSLLLAICLIWLAHIGMDRAMGYGLKEAEGFKFTHLGAL